jgi:hypothetical protein
MTSARTGSIAAALALISLSACQDRSPPGPMERAGMQIDQTMAGVQRGMGEFSQRAGQGLNDAGRSVGGAAQQVGTRLHDRLVPVDTNSAQSLPTQPDGQPITDRSGRY